MSTDLTRLQSVPEIDLDAAQLIVREVSRGRSLLVLHEEHGMPDPLTVNRWRRDYPLFEQAMREAELAKAEALAEEAVRIADDTGIQAARATNAIKVRQWYASKLSERFAAAQTPGNSLTVNINAGDRLSDEQLMSIAKGAVIIEGE